MKELLSRRELDSIVVNTELTLLSITQAIALSFLAEASVDYVVKLEILWWPYILAGLLVILVFWSRSLMHVLTIIRWPLHFAHNFIYIAFTLVESIMFRQIGAVREWFAMSLASAILVWILFALDLSMVRRLKAGVHNATVAGLLAIVEHDQRAQLRTVIPLMILFSGAASALTVLGPEFFVDHEWHLLLAGLQIFFLLWYLRQSLRLYRKIVPNVSLASNESG